MISDNLSQDKNIRLKEQKNVSECRKKAFKKNNKQDEKLIVSFTKKILMKTGLSAICIEDWIYKNCANLEGTDLFYKCVIMFVYSK